MTVGVGVGVFVGATVGVGVGVFVGVTVGVGVGVSVGATVGVGVGVLVGATVDVKVGVSIGVMVAVILSAEDSSVVLLILLLVLVEVSVSSVEVVGIEKRLPKNIIVIITPQSPFLGLNLFLILSQIGGHTSKEHNKNNILFPKESEEPIAKRRNSANSVHFNSLKNFCSILLLVSFSSIIFSPV